MVQRVWNIGLGRELSNLLTAEIEALAKVRESEVKAMEDMVEFMKEVEDKEREDAYSRQELDAKLMDEAKSRYRQGQVHIQAQVQR